MNLSESGAPSSGEKPPPLPHLNRRVKVINRDRDRKFFDCPVLDADGKQERLADGRKKYDKVVLGSREDEGVAGTHQPEIEIDARVWALLSKQKVVRGMVENRSIVVYPA